MSGYQYDFFSKNLSVISSRLKRFLVAVTGNMQKHPSKNTATQCLNRKPVRRCPKTENHSSENYDSESYDRCW